MGNGVLFVILTPFLGILIPTALMVGVNAKLKGTKSIRHSVFLAVGTSAFIFILFQLVLKINLPVGPLGI
jgi:ABC-type sugar transport system permease subunit